jgi:hypothetical protein
VPRDLLILQRDDPLINAAAELHLLAVPPHVAAERLARLEAEPAEVALVRRDEAPL